MDEALPQLALQQELATFFAGLTLAECNARFGCVDCCFNQVLELQDAVNTPHMRTRQLVVQDTVGDFQALYPAYVDGEPPLVRAPFREMKKD